MSNAPAAALGALREVPFMGVIWVVHEASKRGFTNGHPDWCNLGQGQPEVGPMEGAPPRLASVEIRPKDHAYGPLGGTPELRTRIAEHYNRLYRQGKQSKYTADNVCVGQGGRLTALLVRPAPGQPHARPRPSDGIGARPLRFSEESNRSRISARRGVQGALP